MATNTLIKIIEEKTAPVKDKETKLSTLHKEDADMNFGKTSFGGGSGRRRLAFIDDDMAMFKKKTPISSKSQTPSMNLKQVSVSTDKDSIIKNHDPDIFPFRQVPTNKLHDPAYEFRMKERFGTINPTKKQMFQEKIIKDFSGNRDEEIETDDILGMMDTIDYDDEFIGVDTPLRPPPSPTPPSSPVVERPVPSPTPSLSAEATALNARQAQVVENMVSQAMSPPQQKSPVYQYSSDESGDVEEEKSQPKSPPKKQPQRQEQQLLRQIGDAQAEVERMSGAGRENVKLRERNEVRQSVSLVMNPNLSNEERGDHFNKIRDYGLKHEKDLTPEENSELMGVLTHVMHFNKLRHDVLNTITNLQMAEVSGDTATAKQAREYLQQMADRPPTNLGTFVNQRLRNALTVRVADMEVSKDEMAEASASAGGGGAFFGAGEASGGGGGLVTYTEDMEVVEKPFDIDSPPKSKKKAKAIAKPKSPQLSSSTQLVGVTEDMDVGDGTYDIDAPKSPPAPTKPTTPPTTKKKGITRKRGEHTDDEPIFSKLSEAPKPPPAPSGVSLTSELDSLTKAIEDKNQALIDEAVNKLMTIDTVSDPDVQKRLERLVRIGYDSRNMDEKISGQKYIDALAVKANKFKKMKTFPADMRLDAKELICELRLAKNHPNVVKQDRVEFQKTANALAKKLNSSV